MKEVIIYIDGVCSGNSGSGGWCVIFIYKGIKKVLKGFERYIINNRMEFKVVVEVLKVLKELCKVVIYLDFVYIVNVVN